MGKGKGRKRIKVKKKSVDNSQSSGSESALEGSRSPKRKVTSNSARSRSERSSYATEDMYSVNEPNAVAYNVPDVDLYPANSNGSPTHPTVPASRKPPPIMVKNVPLDKLMRTFDAAQVNAEFKLCRVGIKITAANRSDWESIIVHLNKWKAEYYSHDFQGDKPFKSVVRGLPTMDTKIIELELLNRYKLKPLAVYPMRRKEDNLKQFRDCLYLVHFQKGTVTPGALQAVRTIQKVVVRWEPYRGSKNNVTQCQRCLNFGHGTRNCNMKPRCSFCSQAHATVDCLLEGSIKYKCVNCNGNHRGSDRKCPKREEYREIRKKASTINQQGRKRERVPPPAINIANFPALQSSTAARSTTPPPPVPGWGKSQINSPTHATQVSQLEEENQYAAKTDKFDMDKLMEIFDEMVEELSKCQNRREQIQTLGRLIIRYGC